MKPNEWDVESIRGHFVFPRTGRIVSNNAASTQPPRELLELHRSLAPQYENVHRGQSSASQHTTRLFEAAFDDIARFVGAPSRNNIVIVRNTTEAHNAVMDSLLTEFRDGDNVVTTTMEHNSNFVPWFAMCHDILPKFGRRVSLRLARFDPLSGELDLTHLASLIDARTKLVCCTGASNFLGTKNPIAAVKALAEYRGDRLEPVLLEGKIETGGDLSRTRAFGIASFDRALVLLDGTTLPSDGIAHGVIGSSADGKTFYVGAEAPSGSANLPNDPLGSDATLIQVQTFVKRSADASLKVKIPSAFIEVNDRNAVLGRICPPQHAEGLQCPLVEGRLFLDIDAFTTDFPEPRILARAVGSATLSGFAERWNSDAWTYRVSREPFWTVEDFDFVVENADGASESHVVMTLRNPRTFVVDISSVPVGGTFHLRIEAQAFSHNRISGPPSEFASSASAFLGLPLNVGDPMIETTGLETASAPAAVVKPAEVPVSPAACVPGPAPNPAAGVLQFSAATYALSEGSTTPSIIVTRTGGSSGAVTATFTTSNGSAIAGTDYTSVNATVFFADGDATPRRIGVPIIQNLVAGEPGKTVNLALSQPGGCAALGTQATAVLTIRDDDAPPPPPSISVGGTVTGLVGTGLVLRHVTTGENLATGNGPFTFSQLLPNGFAYSVAVGAQPGNPSQVCTVNQGSGAATANITNVAVNCVTPAANGALDRSFGDAGMVNTAFGGDETAMALQADGKIVMVGGSGSDFVLARYNADGSLDTGFGSGGLVTTDFLGNVTGNEAHGVAIQSDGKIVVVGFAVVGRTPRNLSNFDFALARYHIDGTLDLGFGTGGKVTTDFNGVADRGFAVAIQTDGKIVVVGDAGFDTPNGVGADFGLARYNADGTLDTTFGNGGKLTTDIAGGIDIAHNVIVSQGNGAILVSGAGTTAGDAGLDHTGLARYDTHGVLDGSFGTGGKITLTGKRVNEGLVLQGDGKILLAGSVSVGVLPAGSSQFALMRLAPNGSPDLGFGTGGLVTTPFSTQDDFGRAVAVQADGRIVVAGQSSNRSNPDFAVARFSDNGTLDSSFGTGGKLTIDFFGSFDGAENVLMQPDGKIVLGGFARNGTRTGYGLARVLP